jgi:hypothetical protein
MQNPTRILLTAAALAAFNLAHAQTVPTTVAPAAKPTGDTVKLSPVVVSSDLWESPLARIPASVTVYDQDALRAGAVKHFARPRRRDPEFHLDRRHVASAVFPDPRHRREFAVRRRDARLHGAFPRRRSRLHWPRLAGEHV